MDSYELSKIAAAVLSALLLMVGLSTAVHMSGEGHDPAAHHDTHGYALPEPKAAAAGAGGGAAVAAAFDPAKVVAAVATAKPENGQATFKKCQACHTGEKGGANKVGPNLWGLVDRAKGSVAGFAYSDALKAKGGNWTYADLAQFIHDPKSYVAGTKMQFAGIADAGDAADLIAYLRTLADTPAAAPGK